MYLQVIDMSGKIILQKQIAGNAGQNIITFPTGRLAIGVYILNVTQDHNTESGYFIKK
jgi:hypothetical protein